MAHKLTEDQVVTVIRQALHPDEEICPKAKRYIKKLEKEYGISNWKDDTDTDGEDEEEQEEQEKRKRKRKGKEEKSFWEGWF